MLDYHTHTTLSDGELIPAELTWRARHAGLIEAEDVRRAADCGVCLELSARRAHCLASGHLVRLARQLDALHLLIISSDAHGQGDLLTDETVRHVRLGARLDANEPRQLLENAKDFCGR